MQGFSQRKGSRKGFHTHMHNQGKKEQIRGQQDAPGGSASVRNADPLSGLGPSAAHCRALGPLLPTGAYSNALLLCIATFGHIGHNTL